MVRLAREHVDVFTNKIRQLIGLAGFKGAKMKRLTKLAFVMWFLDTISIELQQAVNIKALTMGDLLAWVRMLMTPGERSQDVVVAVHSHCSGAITPAKSDSIARIIGYRYRA